MTVLITGVGGRIGRLVADRLHADGVEVRAGSSRPEQVTDLDYPVVGVDLGRPETLETALQGVEVVLLYAGRGPADRLTEALGRSALDRVVLVSSHSVERPSMARMSAHFVEVEQAVRDSGIAWTFLRGDYFATNTLAWAPELAATGTVSLPYPGSYLEPVHEADLADLGVLALTGDGHTGRAYPLTGPESLTQAEMVATIGAVTGRPAEARGVDESVWRAEFTRHAPEFVADTMLAMWRDADGRPGRSDQTVAAAGLRPRSFREWVEDHAADFTA